MLLKDKDRKQSSQRPEDQQLKNRETQWNSRLNVSPYIPQYNPLIDKHTQSYRKTVQTLHSRRDKKQQTLLRQKFRLQNQQQELLSDSWAQKKAEFLKQRMSGPVARSNERTKQLLMKLDSAWNSAEIPQFIGYYFLKYMKGVTVQLANAYILQQIRTVYNKQNKYFEIKAAVQARQKCLADIRDSLQLFSKASQLVPQNKLAQGEFQYQQKESQVQKKKEQTRQRKLGQIFDRIKNLRRLSLGVIESIRGWRQGLKEMNQKGDFFIPDNQLPQFFFFRTNYLIKLLNDNNFIFYSFLQKHLQFSNNDPFLLKPLKDPLQPSKAHRQTDKERKIYLYMLTQDISFVNKCQQALLILAQEKANQLRSKLSFKQEDIAPKLKSKSTVQRVYFNKRHHQLERQQRQEKQEKQEKPKGEKEFLSKQLAQISQVVDKGENQRLKQIKRHQQRLQAIKKIYKQKNRNFQNDEKKNKIQESQPLKQIKQKSKSVATIKKRTQLQYSDFEKLVRKKQLEIVKQISKKPLPPNRNQPNVVAVENPSQSDEMQDIIKLYKNNQDSYLKQAREQLSIKKGSKRRKQPKVQMSKRILLLENKLFRDQEQKTMRTSASKVYKPVQKKRESKGFQSDYQISKKRILQNLKQPVETKVRPAKRNQEVLEQQLYRYNRKAVSEDQEQIKTNMKEEIRSALQKQIKQKQALRQKIIREEHQKYELMKKTLKDQLERQMSLQKARRQIERMQIQKRIKQEQLRAQTQRQRVEQMLRQREKVEKAKYERDLLQRQKKFKQLIQKEERQKLTIQKKAAAQSKQRLLLQKQIQTNNLKHAIEQQLRKEVQDKLIVEQLSVKRTLQNEAEGRRLSLQRQLQEMRRVKQQQIQGMIVQAQAKEKLMKEMRQRQQKKRADLQRQLYQKNIYERQRLQKQSRLRKEQLQNMIAKSSYELNQTREQESPQSRSSLFRQAALEIERTQKLKLEGRDQSFKRQLLQSHLSSKNISNEVAKNQLRSQFEKQLYQIAQQSKIKSQRSDLRENAFGLKPIQNYNTDQYLDQKIKEIKTKQKKFYQSLSPVHQLQQSNLSIEPESALQLRKQPSKNTYTLINTHSKSPQKLVNKLGMTSQQYEVYLKKKKAVTGVEQERVIQIRDELVLMQKQELQRLKREKEQKNRKMQETIKQQQRKLELDKQKAKQQESNQLKRLELQKLKLIQEEERLRLQWQEEKRRLRQKKERERERREREQEQRKERQKKKRVKRERQLKKLKQRERELMRDLSQQFSEDQQQPVKRKNKKKREEEISLSKSEESESQRQKVKLRSRKSERKEKDKLKLLRQQSESLQEQQLQTNYKQNKHLLQLQELKKQNQLQLKQIRQQQERKRIQLQNKLNQLKKAKEPIKQTQPVQPSSQRKITLQPENPTKERKKEGLSISSKKLSMIAFPSSFIQSLDMEIKVETIQQKKITQFIEKTFLQIPLEVNAISFYSKQQLAHKLFSQLAFTFLVGYNSEGRTTALAFVHHDRNKVDSRRFIIDFLACFEQQHLFGTFVKVLDYLYRKDPCDQVQINFAYKESESQCLRLFNQNFQKIGNIYQKKTEQRTQRKYITKRPFNKKSEIAPSELAMNPFNSIIKFNSNILFSDHQLIVLDKTLVNQTSSENEISYGIMMCEHFRSSLTPEQAEQLKSKVKQSLKLKQLLVLVVNLQKKKVELQEINCQSHKSLTELNMKLLAQGRDTLKMLKDSHLSNNRIYHNQISLEFKMPFDFHTSTLPFQSPSSVKHLSYFRLAVHSNYKLQTLKSALYNQSMHILPTQNPQYKMFIMAADQFIKTSANGTDLFMYVRLFMKNIRSHSQAHWRYIWLPAWSTKGTWKIRQFADIFGKQMWVWDRCQFNYKQYLPSSLLIQPSHKDLVISGRFIMGVISIGLQQCSEGSGVYVRLISEQEQLVFEEEKR